MAEIGKTFSPGDRVPDSGIYDVVHDQHHRPNHHVMCSDGRVFPACQTCGREVRFELAIKVPVINDDSDFNSKQAEDSSILRPAA
jgi:hypothetical protein